MRNIEREKKRLETEEKKMKGEIKKMALNNQHVFTNLKLFYKIKIILKFFSRKLQ